LHRDWSRRALPKMNERLHLSKSRTGVAFSLLLSVVLTVELGVPDPLGGGWVGSSEGTALRDALAPRALHFPGHYCKFLYALNRERTAIVPYRIERGDELTSRRKKQLLTAFRWFGYVEPDFRKAHWELRDSLDYGLRHGSPLPSASMKLNEIRFVTWKSDIAGYLRFIRGQRSMVHLIVSWPYRKLGVGSELFCAGLTEILRTGEGDIILCDVYLEMKRVLCNLGIPHEMRTDNGKFWYPLFRGEDPRYRSNSVLTEAAARQMLCSELQQVMGRITTHGARLPRWSRRGLPPLLPVILWAGSAVLPARHDRCSLSYDRILIGSA